MNQFIITRETAQQLERRKAELEHEMAQLRDEHQKVCRQLEAIPLFLGELNGQPEVVLDCRSVEEEERQLATRFSVPMMLKFVLQKRGRLAAQEIRDAMVKEGVAPEKFGATNSYLYTVLGRLMARSQIQRTRGKYHLPPGVTIEFGPTDEDLKR